MMWLLEGLVPSGSYLPVTSCSAPMFISAVVQRRGLATIGNKCDSKEGTENKSGWGVQNHKRLLLRVRAQRNLLRNLAA